MPRGFHALPVRRWLAGFLLGGVLASAGGRRAAVGPRRPPSTRPSPRPRAACRRATSPAAEGHYREALFEGWLLMATLERLEGRLPEARRGAAQARRSCREEDREGTARRWPARTSRWARPPRPSRLLAPWPRKTPATSRAAACWPRALAAAGQPEQARGRGSTRRARRPADDPEARVPAGHRLPLDEEGRRRRSACSRRSSRRAPDPADPRPRSAAPTATPANTTARAPSCARPSSRTRACAAPTTTSAWWPWPTRARARTGSTRPSRSSGRS